MTVPIHGVWLPVFRWAVVVVTLLLLWLFLRSTTRQRSRLTPPMRVTVIGLGLLLLGVAMGSVQAWLVHRTVLVTTVALVVGELVAIAGYVWERLAGWHASPYTADHPDRDTLRREGEDPA